MPQGLLFGAMEAHLDAHEIVPNQKQSLSKGIRLERILKRSSPANFHKLDPIHHFPLHPPLQLLSNSETDPSICMKLDMSLLVFSDLQVN
jgi:hypothetical protein